MYGPEFIATAVICFLGVTTFLISFHEYGHYLTARMFGHKAQAFSLGFGPEIVGYTDKHGTRWKICPIPLGGYCKFHGELHPEADSTEETADDQNFAMLARWKRAAIIFAGPLVNMLICAALMGGLFAAYGEPVLSPVIENVASRSPAYDAGVRDGDRIVRWNGRTMTGDQSLIRHIKLNPGADLHLRLERDGREFDQVIHIAHSHVVDRFGNHADVGRAGLQFGSTLQPIDNPVVLVGHSFKEALNLFALQSETILQLVRGQRSLDEIAGPVRLAKLSAQQYLQGWTALIYFTAILSIAVSFMNLLPIPGLDGGYLLLYAVEGVIRRDIPKKAFNVVFKVGYGCIFALMIFAFSNDFRVLFYGS